MAKPLKILIVDDEPSAREFLREMLTNDVLNGSAEIIGECTTGREAREALRTIKPDLVFLDVQMPEMNGFDVLSDGLFKQRNLPFVIFVTATTSTLCEPLKFKRSTICSSRLTARDLIKCLNARKGQSLVSERTIGANES